MSTKAQESRNPLWKPPKEVKRAITRGDRKFKDHENAVLAAELERRAAEKANATVTPPP